MALLGRRRVVAEMGDVVVTTEHRLDPRPGGRTEVVYRTVITEPAPGTVGSEIGPGITADFSEVVAALIREARRC